MDKTDDYPKNKFSVLMKITMDQVRDGEQVGNYINSIEIQSGIY